MKKILIIACSLALVAGACKKKDKNSSTTTGSGYRPAATVLPSQRQVFEVEAGQWLTVYIDGRTFDIRAMELSGPAAEDIAGSNQQMGTIFKITPMNPEQVLLPVLDGPPNKLEPLWREEFVVFNRPFKPHQFISAKEIKVALAEGEIHLISTSKLFRCESATF